MHNPTSITLKEEVATILYSLGHTKANSLAEKLEKSNSKIRALHLRGMGLQPTHAHALAKVLRKSEASELKSISLSYNPGIGFEGLAALVKAFPLTLQELGLVGCGLEDSHGRELLLWLQQASTIRMVCIEQNQLTDELKAEFKTWSRQYADVLVVV